MPLLTYPDAEGLLWALIYYENEEVYVGPAAVEDEIATSSPAKAQKIYLGEISPEAGTNTNSNRLRQFKKGGLFPWLVEPSPAAADNNPFHFVGGKWLRQACSSSPADFQDLRRKRDLIRLLSEWVGLCEETVRFNDIAAVSSPSAANNEWYVVNTCLKKSELYRKLSGIGSIVPILSEGESLFTYFHRLQRIHYTAKLIKEKLMQGTRSVYRQKTKIDSAKVNFFTLCYGIGIFPFSQLVKYTDSSRFANTQQGITCAVLANAREFTLDILDSAGHDAISEFSAAAKVNRTPFYITNAVREFSDMLALNVQSVCLEARIAAYAYEIVRTAEEMIFAKISGTLDDADFTALKADFESLYGAGALSMHEGAFERVIDRKIQRMIAGYIDKINGTIFSSSQPALLALRRIHEQIERLILQRFAKIYDLNRIKYMVSSFNRGTAGFNGSMFAAGLSEDLLSLSEIALLKLSVPLAGSQGLCDWRLHFSRDEKTIMTWEQCDCRKQIRQLRDEHMTIGEISRQLGITRQFVWLELSAAKTEGLLLTWQTGQQDSDSLAKVKKAIGPYLVLAAIVRQPFITSTLGVGPKVLPKLPIDAEQVAADTCECVLNKLIILFGMLQEYCGKVGLSFESLFSVNMHQKLCLAGELQAVAAYDIRYMRHRGVEKAHEKENKHILQETIGRKLGRYLRNISNIETGMVHLTLDKIGRLVRLYAGDDFIFDDLSYATDECIAGRNRLERIQQCYALFFSTAPLEEVRAILMAAKNVNTRSAAMRRQQGEVRGQQVTRTDRLSQATPRGKADTRRISYAHLVKSVFKQNSGSAKQKYRHLKVSGDALAVLSYNFGLLQCMGVPTPRVKAARSKDKRTSLITPKDIIFCMHGHERLILWLEGKDRKASSKAPRLTYFKIHLLVSTLASKENFVFDDIPDSEENRFTAIVEALFSLETIQQAQHIVQMAEEINSVSSKERTAQKMGPRRFLSLVSPRKREEWQLTGEALAVFTYNLGMVMVRSTVQPAILHQRSQIGAASMTRADLGHAMHRSEQVAGGIFRADGIIRLCLTTLHSIVLSIASQNNFQLEDLPTHQSAACDERGASQNIEKNTRAIETIDLFFNMPRIEQARNMLRRIQANDDLTELVTDDTSYYNLTRIIFPVNRTGEFILTPGGNSRKLVLTALNSCVGKGAQMLFSPGELPARLQISRNTWRNLNRGTRAFSFTFLHDMLLVISQKQLCDFNHTLDKFLPYADNHGETPASSPSASASAKPCRDGKPRRMTAGSPATIKDGIDDAHNYNDLERVKERMQQFTSSLNSVPFDQIPGFIRELVEFQNRFYQCWRNTISARIEELLERLSALVAQAKKNISPQGAAQNFLEYFYALLEARFGRNETADFSSVRNSFENTCRALGLDKEEIYARRKLIKRAFDAINTEARYLEAVYLHESFNREIFIPNGLILLFIQAVSGGYTLACGKIKSQEIIEISQKDKTFQVPGYVVETLRTGPGFSFQAYFTSLRLLVFQQGVDWLINNLREAGEVIPLLEKRLGRQFSKNALLREFRGVSAVVNEEMWSYYTGIWPYFADASQTPVLRERMVSDLFNHEAVHWFLMHLMGIGIDPFESIEKGGEVIDLENPRHPLLPEAAWSVFADTLFNKDKSLLWQRFNEAHGEQKQEIIGLAFEIASALVTLIQTRIPFHAVHSHFREALGDVAVQGQRPAVYSQESGFILDYFVEELKRISFQPRGITRSEAYQYLLRYGPDVVSRSRQLLAREFTALKGLSIQRKPGGLLVPRVIEAGTAGPLASSSAASNYGRDALIAQLVDTEECRELCAIAKKLGLDLRPVENGLLHPAYVGFYQQGAGSVVRALNTATSTEPTAALYALGGPDWVSAVLSTQADEIHIADRAYPQMSRLLDCRQSLAQRWLKIRGQRVAGYLNLLWGCAALGQETWELGYFVSSIYGSAIENIEMKTLGTLLCMGVSPQNIIGIEEDASKNTITIKFNWASHKGKEKLHTLVFHRVRDIADVNKYPRSLNELLERGIQAYFQKSAIDIDLCYSSAFMPKILKSISDCGYAIFLFSQKHSAQSSGRPRVSWSQTWLQQLFKHFGLENVS
ncbi:MAG: hypothetical protein PHQ96_08935, partial [Candidatus Omnitrophica bacterium]|nr:hypothetical protein [Candidatus Omnitrophota bacterium]